jgi:hypothetical protein
VELEKLRNELPKDLQEILRHYQKWRALPSKGILEELYWGYGLSIADTSKLFKVNSTATVRYWFKKYGIGTRRVGSRMQYLKKSFNGTLEEAAYRLGIAHADFYVRVVGRQTYVSVATTHKSMVDLFCYLHDS